MQRLGKLAGVAACRDRESSVIYCAPGANTLLIFLSDDLHLKAATMSESIFDGILHQIEQLPVLEQRRLMQTVMEKVSLVQPSPAEASKFREPLPEPDYEPSARWIKEHRSEYGGQWVALDGDRLIVHSTDADAVFAAARQDGAYLPLVTFIEPADAPPFLF